MRTRSQIASGTALVIVAGVAAVGLVDWTRGSDDASTRNQTPSSQPPVSPSTSAPSPQGSSAAELPLGTVPASYDEPAERPGSLEVVTYESNNQPGGSSAGKDAVVYLPPGYDPDESTRYDVLYLMHGGASTVYSWLGSPDNPTGLSNVLDHMIADDVIEPTIVVTPTFNTNAVGDFTPTADAFYDELVADLLPRIEGSYRTYAEGVTPDELAAAREHRVFGGFSMGSVTTWHMFTKGLDYFANFLPMSGDSWIRGQFGGRDEPDDTADTLAEAAVESGYSRDDYAIFAATGTEDTAYEPMNNQIEAMRSRTEAFDFTDVGFGEGNLMYYVVEGNAHDYPYGYDYIYSGLPRLLGRA